MRQEEFATLGGAIIGGRMVGFWDDPVEVATRFAKPGDRIEPRKESLTHYKRYADFYTELIPGMRGLFKRLTAI